MKIIIASSDKNRIEERVAVHSLIKSGHSLDEIDIIDGDTGLIYDALREKAPRVTGLSDLGGSTSFTMARLFIPLFYTDDRIVVIDSDVIVYDHLSGIFENQLKPGIYVRKAYASDEWATSVMGWHITPQIREMLPNYRRLIEGEEFSWKDKIYLKKAFLNAIRIPLNRISRSWNSFDKVTSKTKLVHFTNLATQPWKRDQHPCEGEWFKYAKEALNSGTLTQNDIEIHATYRGIILANVPLLREDFIDRLHRENTKSNIIVLYRDKFLLLYRNLKFFTPVRFIYSELNK